MIGATGKRSYGSFGGFQVGSVFAAFVIAVGIEAFVRVLSWPMAAMATEVINYIVRTGRFGIATISPPNLPLILKLEGGIAGALLLLCGLRFAAWLTARAEDKSSN